MSRIDARGVIATVEYPHPFGNGAVVERPGEPMGKYLISPRDAEPAVSGPDSVCLPFPALIGSPDSDLRPESLLGRKARARHLSDILPQFIDET